jgi:hypothetical protein
MTFMDELHETCPLCGAPLDGTWHNYDVGANAALAQHFNEAHDSGGAWLFFTCACGETPEIGNRRGPCHADVAAHIRAHVERGDLHEVYVRHALGVTP